MTNGITSGRQASVPGPSHQLPQPSRPFSPENSDQQDREGEQAKPPREPEHKPQLLRAKLSSLVTEYRDKRLSKLKAVSKISTLIDDDANLPELEKEKAINFYIEELNAIDHDRRPALFASRLKKEEAVDLAVERLLDEVSNASKRANNSSEHDSDDPDEPPRKKRKVSESEMGWYDPDDPSPYSNIASCRKTCERLEVYNKDIAGSKFLAKLSRHAPAGIPSTQWERVFRGEALDLDHFLSSLHRTTITEEGETRIRNAKTSLEVADAKRRVSTASEWSSAWRLASRAVAFAFPHRAEELRDYGDFIESEFAAKLPSSHPRIILFDIAIRNIVQGGHNALLTDRALHLRFYSAILMPDGVSGNASASSNRRSSQPRPSGSKTDICNRFNTSGGCPSSDSSCKYRHTCKNCKKGGHGKESCPK